MRAKLDDFVSEMTKTHPYDHIKKLKGENKRVFEILRDQMASMMLDMKFEDGEDPVRANARFLHGAAVLASTLNKHDLAKAIMGLALSLSHFVSETEKLIHLRDKEH